MLAACLRVLERAPGEGTATEGPLHIVEFCSGSGHIGLPLAWLLLQQQAALPALQRQSPGLNGHNREFRLTLLDMSAQALDHAKGRIKAFREHLRERFGEDHVRDVFAVKPQYDLGSQQFPGMMETFLSVEVGSPLNMGRIRLSFVIAHCMVSEYAAAVARCTGAVPVFHLGVALHACGRATDEVIALCCEERASFVVAPCCIGRIGQTVSLDRLDVATGGLVSTSRFRDGKWDSVRGVAYPRSRLFGRNLGLEDFKVLAKAADWHEKGDGDGGEEDVRGEQDAKARDSQRRPSGALGIWDRRLAKVYVERDRLECARERGYAVELVKMQPPSCTPKNDVLIGRFSDAGG